VAELDFTPSKPNIESMDRLVKFELQIKNDKERVIFSINKSAHSKVKCHLSLPSLNSELA
jgi:hypothetical protein